MTFRDSDKNWML